jgi:hypothetical protein
VEPAIWGPGVVHDPSLTNVAWWHHRRVAARALIVLTDPADTDRITGTSPNGIGCTNFDGNTAHSLKWSDLNPGNGVRECLIYVWYTSGSCSPASAFDQEFSADSSGDCWSEPDENWQAKSFEVQCP